MTVEFACQLSADGNRNGVGNRPPIVRLVTRHSGHSRFSPAGIARSVDASRILAVGAESMHSLQSLRIVISRASLACTLLSFPLLLTHPHIISKMSTEQTYIMVKVRITPPSNADTVLTRVLVTLAA